MTGARAWKFVLLSVLSALGGFAEAAVLVLVVQIALRLARSQSGLTSGGIFSTDKLALSTLFVLAASLCVVRSIAFAGSSLLGASISTKVMVSARTQLFSGFIRASWPVQSSEAQSHLQDLTTTQMVAAASYALVVAGIVTSGINFLTLLLSAVAVNPIAAVVMVAIAGILFVVLRPLSRLAKQQSLAQSLGTTEYGSAISQAVNLAQESRVFHVDDEFDSRLKTAANDVAVSYFRAQVLNRLVPTTYQSLALLLVVGALWFLHELHIGPIAGIGAVVVLLVRSLSYGQLLQGAYNDLQYYIPYAERVETAIETYRRHELKGGTIAVGGLESLELDRVSYSYDGEVLALSDISFAVGRGEIVGIAGPSGAGKSTLVEILLRLRSPTRGRYLVNGIPADELDLESWYPRLALVRQEARLLTGTVEENIRFLRDGFDDDDVARAARMAHLETEILSRPGGFAAAIGDRGGALSGGQRQRLTIARAIIGAPELVILDEPTSALDMIGESVIHGTLDALRGQAMVFVVAHRPSTLRICDRIMILEHGRLAAFDEPGNLASTSPFFKQAMELSRLD
jgi:ABC-type multidrug transport system fused ATPase/permease subunit